MRSADEVVFLLDLDATLRDDGWVITDLRSLARHGHHALNPPPLAAQPDADQILGLSAPREHG